MAKAGLLQAVCTAALLAAAPAFAQTANPQATTGTDNSVVDPAHTGTTTGGSTGSTSSSSTMTPANQMGSTSNGNSNGSAMNTQSSPHHSGRSTHAMRGRNDMSQDAAVDQLNDQSYRAAQRGQNFSAANMNGGSNMGSSSGMSGSGMSGNSMPSANGAAAPRMDSKGDLMEGNTGKMVPGGADHNATSPNAAPGGIGGSH